MRAAVGNQLDSVKAFSFTPRDFARVRRLIYERAGIALADSKQEMVYSRLARRLRAKGLHSFEEYLDELESSGDAEEWEAFTNALTTNMTSFFREAHHFPMLAEHVRSKRSGLTVWCSASSTGEEPYSIAITLCETFNTLTPPAKIIATDIDTKVLETAENGIYDAERVSRLSAERVRRFFMKGKGSRAGLVRVRPELREMIEFKQLNLLAPDWPISGPLDAIFCRNVMIYFDRPTQEQILARFAPLLRPDGLLFVGHSENFTHASNQFTLRGKTVYQAAQCHYPSHARKCT